MCQPAWKRISRIFLISKIATSAAIALCFTSVCCAQITYDGNQNLPPFGGFSGSDFDLVSLQNGNLHLHIPVGTWQQRGGKTISVMFVYDSAAWLRQTTVTTVSGHRLQITNSKINGARPGTLILQSTAGSWIVSSAIDKCLSPSTQQNINLYDAWNITDPEGTKHPVALSVAPGDCGANIPSGPATDGSGMMVNLGSTPPVLLLKDGTKIILQGSVFNYAGSSWEDPNGNLSGTTDTMGRTLVTVSQGPNTTLTTPLGNKTTSPAYTLYTVLDSNGSAQSYRLDYAAIDVLTNFCPAVEPPGGSCSEYSATRVVPAKLTLPTGLFYQFSWINSSPQELQSITLPTGGSVSYTYSSACTQGPVPDSQSGTTAPFDCLGAVVTRTVTANGTSNEWTYAGGTVTDPTGNVEVHVFSEITINSVSSPNSVETQVSYYQGSASTGKLLKQVITGYTGEAYRQFLVNLRPISTTTILDNGLESQVQTDYETFPANGATFTRLNPTEIREYDYGSGAPGTLLRKTDYTYLHNSNSAYLNLNIVDRPASVVIFNGSGSIVAQTQYEYDNYTQGVQASGAVEHDAGRGTSYATRGNKTATKNWRNTDGAFLTTRNQYDDAGNVVSITDPLNHTTSFDFTDSWANSTCAPSGGQAKVYPTQSTNALNQVTTYKYYSCTGLRSSVADQNDINAGRAGTIYTYDLMNRPLSTTYSDGGSISFSYSDVVPVSVTTRKALTASASLTTTTAYDGLARVVQTQLTSDPQGTDLVNTTYDPLGRVASVSNPYRSTSDPTYGVTTYNYDALGRKTQITDTDGSVASTSYSGNCTTVTDEAGKNRESCTDGLGRMMQVIENPGGLGYVTNYTYDPLDDLTAVVQGGSRNRSFTYDSLKRMTQSVNPESGTIKYSYDANGNVSSKTDNRGITTTYSYDALNRVTGMTYSNGDPPVSYTYDQSSANGLTITNGIGQRTSMTDAAGSEAWSYDSMGRTLVDQRTTKAGATNITRSFGYTYSPFVDGSIANIAYPSGLSLTYAYDGAGRPLSVKDQNGNTYANNASYAPQGALQAATMDATANFAGFAVSNSYTKRLQPNEMKVTNGSSSVMDLGYCFYALSGGACPSSGTTDNGNVTAIINKITSTRSQTFAYDALNRISIGGSVATSGSGCWGEQYGYDAWGNLQTVNLPSNYATSCMLPDNLSVSATGANQISGYTYDAAGNLTTIPGTGGASYTYNAESELTSTAGVNYQYDGDGKRAAKTNMQFWYGMSSDPLEETNASVLLGDYVFFGGVRIAGVDSHGNIFAYFDDHLGSAHEEEEIAAGASTATLSFDADYYPFGREQRHTNSVTPNYQFEGKMRDAESGLDDFGARYYSSNLGRWLSADWSAVPVPVPYANLTNPQTLNLYAMVSDNPETFADLDGHDCCDIWDVIDFVGGFINAYSSDNLAGAGRVQQDSTAGQSGAAAGDAVATVQGGLEMAGGAGGEIGGLVLDSTGALAFIGIPANVASAGLIAHGAVTAGTGAENLVKDAVNAPMQSRAGDLTSSEKAQMDLENANSNGGQNRCTECGQDVQKVQNKKGQPTPRNQLQRHHDPLLSQGGHSKSPKNRIVCLNCHVKIHKEWHLSAGPQAHASVKIPQP